jgi:succinate dehydrogenase / fumarate reductase cytochrome b subunit
MDVQPQAIPQEFVWRRLHSLAGFGLVIFLFFHLFTNSMAGLYIGDDGRGFIESVNAIHDTPYLQVVEILLLGLPILVHMAWGIKYLRTSSINSFASDGSRPALPQYPRNQAYTWQRITSWLLLVGIIAHVVHMRFVESPLEASIGLERSYVVRITEDSGLPLLADRLGIKLYNAEQLDSLPQAPHPSSLPESKEILQQRELEYSKWVATLQERPLSKGEVVAVTESFGAAELLVVRDTFKIPHMVVLYTIFVLAATFHAFNGMWTFMISWGVTLSQRSQMLMRVLTVSLMVLVTFFGMSAIWLTYWINLKS